MSAESIVDLADVSPFLESVLRAHVKGKISNVEDLAFIVSCKDLLAAHGVINDNSEGSNSLIGLVGHKVSVIVSVSLKCNACILSGIGDRAETEGAARYDIRGALCPVDLLVSTSYDVAAERSESVARELQKEFVDVCTLVESDHKG